MAEYLVGKRRVKMNAVPNDDFTLTLAFDNGEKRFYDMKPSLNEDIYVYK